MPKHLKITLIALICLVAAKYISFQLYASGYRLFTEWESIGSPPEKIEKLVGIEIGSDTGGEIYNGRDTKIYVLSLAGKLYSCCTKSDRGWMEEGTNKSNEEIFADCNEAIIHSKLSDELSRKTMNWCGEFDSGKVTYVLRSDGTISYKKDFSRPFTLFPLCFIVPVGVMLSLGVLYILDIVTALIRRKI